MLGQKEVTKNVSIGHRCPYCSTFGIFIIILPVVSGANFFSKIRQYRNEIFHTSSMELDETGTNSYIDDMITVLQDGKEIVNKPDAQKAVKN